MKKLTAFVLTLILIINLIPAAFAESDDAGFAADKLHDLGLFNGTGTNDDGTPVYDLDREPTRNEAVTMLVRLLGKEEEAKAGTWETPFTDVAEWARPYVGYAYANGLTNGTGETTFGGGSLITASQYLTFVLRALGYSSSTDFKWNAAWDLSDRLGITHGEYNADSRFMRGDVAQISVSALPVAQKGSTETLAQKLIADGVFTEAQYRTAMGEAADTGFDPNSPENLELYTFEYDPAQDGYVITDYRRNAEHLLDSDVCALPSEYNGKPVTELRTYMDSYADSILIPASVVKLGLFQNIANCREFIVAENNPAFCAVDGVLMNSDQTELIRYPEAKETDSYTIPDSVRTIAGQAIRGQFLDRKLAITVPSSVTYVEEYAFNVLDHNDGNEQVFPDVTIRILGSTAGWDLKCFARCSASIEASFGAFRAVDTEVTDETKGYVGVGSIEYASNGDMAVLRVQYHNYKAIEETIQISASVSNEYYSNWFTNESDGEVLIYLPKDHAQAEVVLTIFKDSFARGNNVAFSCWIYPNGTPNWAELPPP